MFPHLLHSGVTYDSYDEVFYWAIAGGQSNLFTASSPTEPASVLYSSLRNPSALKLDWVSRRLFWVETGVCACTCTCTCTTLCAMFTGTCMLRIVTYMCHLDGDFHG